jgi:hypothetical protein
MLGRRQLMHQEGTNGTRNREFKEQLRLGNERTTRGIYRKSAVLEIAKLIGRRTVGIQKIKDWAVWRGRPLQNEQKTAHRGESGNVKAPAPTYTDRIDRTLSGAARDERT